MNDQGLKVQAKKTSATNANITFTNDGYGNTTWYARCFWPNITSPNFALIQVNDWHLPSGYTLQNALLHEMGHAYGLDHNSDSKTLMYPYVQTTVLTPSADDVKGVKDVYK